MLPFAYYMSYANHVLETRAWCEEYCTGKWTYDDGYRISKGDTWVKPKIVIYDEDDFILFKLRWL